LIGVQRNAGAASRTFTALAERVAIILLLQG